MNRLQEELQRLYGPQADAGLRLELDVGSPDDAPGQVQAMVLELARPADWAALSAVWGGVQADLALPAPAIAVNGSDGCQLWFSLSEPVPVAKAAAFLDALRRRYLGDILPLRVGMLPALDAAPARPLQRAWPEPALQADSGLWSAFVASDLAAMFADEPWLDMPPNPDGQAQLLAPLKRMAPADFELALQQLQPTTAAAAPGPRSDGAAPAAAALDPKRFLLDVMHNDSLDLALRMEAAKALLPYCHAVVGQRQDR